MVSIICMGGQLLGDKVAWSCGGIFHVHDVVNVVGYTCSCLPFGSSRLRFQYFAVSPLVSYQEVLVPIYEVSMN